MLDGRSSADNTGYDSSSSSSPTTVAPKKKENKEFNSVGDDLDDEIPF